MADTIILEFAGGEIAGECLIKGEEDNIIIDSMNYGVQVQMTGDVADTKRTVGRANVSEISISKTFDISSPKLFHHCAVATHFPMVTIKMYQTDGQDDSQIYLEYELTDVIISSVNVSSSAGGYPMESLSLNFSEIMWKYHQQGTDTAQSGTLAYSYDLKSGLGASS